jgi:hypothetical protein
MTADGMSPSTDRVASLSVAAAEHSGAGIRTQRNRVHAAAKLRGQSHARADGWQCTTMRQQACENFLTLGDTLQAALYNYSQANDEVEG